MELSKWLTAGRGRHKALAKHFGKTPASITFWRTKGVPLPLMREVSAFTKGEVPVKTLLAEALRAAEARAQAQQEA